MPTPAPDPEKLAAAQAEQSARRKAQLINAMKVTIHVDDREWTFIGGEATARHADLLHQATRARGESWVDPVWYVLDYLVANAGAPADMVARLIFLARLQAGEKVTLDEVLDSIPLGAVIWLELPDELPDLDGEVAFPDPPSSGGGSGD